LTSRFHQAKDSREIITVYARLQLWRAVEKQVNHGICCVNTSNATSETAKQETKAQHKPQPLYDDSPTRLGGKMLVALTTKPAFPKQAVVLALMAVGAARNK
jgi:hypothetical protein